MTPLRIARSPGRTIVLTFSLLYFLFAALAAMWRPFWNDELFTYYIAHAPTLASLVEAVRTGADQHPLPYYLIERWSAQLVGWNELGLRLPSMYAGWVLGLVGYALGLRYGGVPGGALAMGLTLLSGAYHFDTEARGYALTVMFGGLATVVWVFYRHRGYSARAAVTVLLAAATLSHYYGAFLAIPFVMAEAANANRRWAQLILPLVGPGVAAAASLPFLTGAQTYASVFWGRPSFPALLDTYATALGPALTIGFLILGLAIARLRHSTLDGKPVPLPTEEAVLFLSFLILPIIAMAVVSVTTRAFAPRYVLGSMIGLGPLTVIGLRSLGASARWLSAVAALLGILWVGREINEAFYTRWQARDQAGRIGWIQQHSEPGLPIVSWWGSAFLVISHYAPESIAQRMRFVADPDAAMHYEGENLSDRGMLALKPWFPAGIIDLPTLARDYPRFMLFGETWWDGRWNWLFDWLIRNGWHIRPVAQDHNIWLFLVERP